MPHVELPQAEFKVVMLGDTFTGKTSLVLRFAEGYYRESGRDATVGAFFITKRLSVQGITCKVQIWDTAGQEQFKRLAPMYYKNAAAAIVCYDITSPESFETLKYWVNELQQNVPAGGIVLAMCATKCDLAAHPDTVAAEELALTTGAMFLSTSAKSNTNVNLLFEKVAERVLQFQKQDTKIPVTLGTTSVETPASAANNNRINGLSVNSNMDGSSGTSIVDAPRIATPPTSGNKNSATRSPLDGKRQRNQSKEDDDTVVDPTESKDTASTAEVNTRCDANMLMCGEVLKGEDASGCVIL